MAQQPILYMMFGYPGAGKTTTAEIIAKLSGAVHLSSDKLRIELFPQPSFSETEHSKLYTELDRRAEALLVQGKDVVYDANLNRHEHRKEKYEICRRTGATPKLIWIQTDKHTAKSRAIHESRQQLWPREETPEMMFERIAGILEPPADDEPFVSINGSTITPEQVQNILL